MDDGTRTHDDRDHNPGLYPAASRPRYAHFLTVTICSIYKIGVDDGTRTHDDRDHNPGLYQLSYAHHNLAIVSARIYRVLVHPARPKSLRDFVERGSRP